MDGITLLEEARAVGLVVNVVGNKLVIRGPRSAGSVAERLLAHKPAVIQALQGNLVGPTLEHPSEADSSNFVERRGDRGFPLSTNARMIQRGPSALQDLESKTCRVVTDSARMQMGQHRPRGKAPDVHCRRCGSGVFIDVPIHDGESTRRDCGECGFILGFPVWYGVKPG